MGPKKWDLANVFVQQLLLTFGFLVSFFSGGCSIFLLLLEIPFFTVFMLGGLPFLFALITLGMGKYSKRWLYYNYLSIPRRYFAVAGMLAMIFFLGRIVMLYWYYIRGLDLTHFDYELLFLSGVLPFIASFFVWRFSAFGRENLWRWKD